MLMFEGISASVSAAMDLVVSYRHNNISFLDFFQGKKKEGVIKGGVSPSGRGKLNPVPARSALGLRLTAGPA